MGLSVGIVGLPNVGKSTLFNALLKKQQAYVANFPFATIEPNIGVVPVPDDRLEQLRKVVESEILGKNSSSHSVSQYPSIPVVPATVEFIDIAGLIAGAHKGEGLGNKFLAHIREVDAICHVVRAFSDPSASSGQAPIVKEGSISPKSDFGVVETELALADLQTLEKQKDLGNTPQKFRGLVGAGTMLRSIELADEEEKLAKELSLLSVKPVLVVLNVDEKDLVYAESLEANFAKETNLNSDQVIAISAKVESELSELSEEDSAAYLKELGVEKSGLARLIKKAFKTLGLITFLTAGEKEVRAWTLRRGEIALRASGVIHSDFEKNFIKADVVNFEDFVGGWKAAHERGLVRSEGKEYPIKDGDVIEFKIGAQ